MSAISRLPQPSRRRRFALAVLVTCFAPPPGASAEVRCGWLENPTPGNRWLKDHGGEWIISMQGGPYAEGVERLPEPSADRFVKTNGDYGFSCACVKGAFDPSTTSVARIDAARILPLSACRNDRKLQGP